MWTLLYLFSMAAAAQIRIAGNVHYVGTAEDSSYLITTPQGHILLDTATADAAPAIQANVERAGARFKDIRILISSSAEAGHTGGHAWVRRLTGARIFASKADAALLQSGGQGLAPVTVDRVLEDGAVVSHGGVTLTAHLTPGQTPGSTTWTTVVQDGGRALRVVFAGGLGINPGVVLVQNGGYPSIDRDYAATFRKFKTLEPDIFLAQRPDTFRLAEKASRLRAGRGANPFIDPEGYRNAVAAAEAAFRAELQRQQTAANHWPQFRGPNGLGVSATAAPGEFGPDKNVLWKAAIPTGHSSPVIAGDRIFLTGEDGGSRSDAGREKVTSDGKLYTICLDRRTGRELWRRELPRPRRERYQPTNSAASPSPVTDGNTVYVFSGDYGLAAYRFDGEELWRLPLGPFNNVNGHGSSPVLHGNKLYLICDQDSDSYLVAVDKDTGKVAWKVERPEVTRGYATPAIFDRPGGPAELIVPGAYQLNSYDAETGSRLWWVRGQSWQPKSVPVIHGDTIYAHSWEGGGEAEQPTETAPLAEILGQWDDDKDGFLSEKETRDPRWQRSFYTIDLNGDGKVNEKEWEFFRARRAARNRLVAIRGGGRGDITGTHVTWSMQKFLPNVPSPLLYDGVLYLIKDGGVLSAIDPTNGAILKQGRLAGAIDTYYASPVAAGGKIYFVSQQGKATVVKAGREWEIAHTVEMEDECFGTPAIVAGDLFLRTRSALYCFRAR